MTVVDRQSRRINAVRIHSPHQLHSAMKTIARCLPPVLLCFLLIVGITISCSKKEEVVPKSTGKAITAFGFNALSPAVAGTVSGNSIAATVPFSVDVTSLVPTISASSKATVSPATGVTQNFSNPVTYTVTAEDGSTATYTVTVTKSAAPKSTAKDITAFSFGALSPAVTGVIDNTAKTISAALPAGADATKLVPTITTSAKATVSPATGAAQDFTKLVPYTVTAEDGSTQTYSVTVTVPKLQTVTIDCNGTIPEVWEDLGDGVDYIVKCNLTFKGTTIYTIKPGVKIQFDGGSAGFTIAGTAALKMIGTAAKPIILEGKVASAGSWQGVVMEANNLENQWEYVTVRHAGSVQATAAGLLVDGFNESKIGIKNCTFSDNTGYGIRVGSNGTSSNWYTKCKFTAFSTNTFSNNSKSAVRVHYAQWGDLDTKSDYVNNGQKYIEIFSSNINNYDALLDGPATIEKLNVPYRVFGILEPNESFIFSKGVEVQFGTDAGIFLATRKKNVAIIANGTAAEPIKFVGYLPNTKGVWAGISTQNGNIETKFNYCIIDGAGSTAEPFFCVPKTSKSAIYLGLEYNCTPEASKGTITNCTISNSGGYGIAYRSSDPVTAKDNTFTGNTKADFYDFK